MYSWSRYPLPTFLIDLGNYFRATGRFIWPLAYSLTILPVAALFRWWRPAPAIAAALMAVCLQIQEAKPGLEYRRQQMAQPNEELIDTSLVESWLAPASARLAGAVMGLRRPRTFETRVGKSRGQQRAAGAARGSAARRSDQQRVQLAHVQGLWSRAGLGVAP